MTSSKRVFSGIQPTGEVHVGNYVGAIRNWVSLQSQYSSTFCIVDYHAITGEYEPKQLFQRSLEVAATGIAAGLDPERVTLYVQSSVPEHTELTWFLTSLTSVGALERMTQYKEKSTRGQGSLAGLMNYPILQTADIILYKANLVPVGEDQVQHLELAREIVRRFNHLFGEYFPEPEPLLTTGARVMSLSDPTSKMSKSVEGSYIGLTEEPESIRRKIKRAVTDPGPQGGEPGPGVKNLFTLLEAFAPEEIAQGFRQDYAEQKLRYSDLKETLAECMVETLGPITEKRAELLSKPDELREILAAGGDRAREQARATIRDVRELMGFQMPVR